MWINFPQLLVECFSEAWLRKAADQTGRTIRVDRTTLATTRGRFARVCIEFDMGKPLRAKYMMRGKNWRIQYEGLYDLCFKCGKYMQREACLTKKGETAKDGISDKGA